MPAAGSHSSSAARANCGIAPAARRRADVHERGDTGFSQQADCAVGRLGPVSVRQQHLHEVAGVQGGQLGRLVVGEADVGQPRCGGPRPCRPAGRAPLASRGDRRRAPTSPRRAGPGRRRPRRSGRPCRAARRAGAPPTAAACRGRTCRTRARCAVCATPNATCRASSRTASRVTSAVTWSGAWSWMKRSRSRKVPSPSTDSRNDAVVKSGSSSRVCSEARPPARGGAERAAGQQGAAGEHLDVPRLVGGLGGQQLHDLAEVRVELASSRAGMISAACSFSTR